MTPRFLVWAANWVGHELGSGLQEENTEMSSTQLDNMVQNSAAISMERYFSFQHVGGNGSHGCIGGHWERVCRGRRHEPKILGQSCGESQQWKGRWRRKQGPRALWHCRASLLALTLVFSFRNGSAIGLPVPPITALITPGPVRHCQIPDLPVDGSLLFEFLFFIYLLVALFIQYINIYKTVWWYPYNHPASCTSLVSLNKPLSSSCYLAKKLVGKLCAEIIFLTNFFSHKMFFC